jgi:AraC-like DNA-binding protein
MPPNPPLSVLAGTFRRFPDFAAQCGLRPAALLRAAGIDRQVLETSGARLPLTSAARLLTLSAQRAARPDFGLQLGLLHHPSDLGALGFLWLSAPDAGTAMAAGTRFDAFVQGGSAFAVAPDEHFPGAIAIDYATPGLGAEWRAQDAEFTFAVLLTALRRITTRPITPRALCFAHPRAAPAATYRAAFGTTPTFAAGANRLVLPAGTLALPIPTQDPALFDILSDYLEQQTNALAQPASLPHAVAHQIEQTLGRAPVTLPAIAASLRIAPRSLQRALAEHGTSFETILAETRTAAARAALRDTQLPISEVATRAGFADATSFARAFRARHGVSPRAWKKGLLFCKKEAKNF